MARRLPEKETKSLFIAVDIPDQVKTTLGSIQDVLKPKIRSAKWVKREGMHITIKFLGQCKVSDIQKMDQILDKIAGKIDKFEFTLSSLGVFPSLKRARVLWAGAGEGFREFRELAKATDNNLIKLGFIPEKRAFNAHITLARIRDPYPIDGEILEQAGRSLSPDPMTAESLVLYESQLSPKGAHYVKLSEHQLKK